MSISSPSGVTAPRANISGYKLRSTPNYTPEQMQLYSKLLGSLNKGGGLEGGVDYYSKLASGDEEAFGQLEAPAYRAFEGQLGQIGSRFADVGALGSSAFQNATSGAAADFGERIGAQRMGIQQNAIDRLLGLTDNALSKQPYDNYLEKKNSFGGILGEILSKLLGEFNLNSVPGVGKFFK